MGDGWGGWRYGSLVLAALLSAPLAVTVHELLGRESALELVRVNRERELAVVAREHESRQQLALVGQALDAHATPEARQRTLRFLYAVSTDQTFRQWAEVELASLQLDVDGAREPHETVPTSADASPADAAAGTKPR